LAGSSKRGHSTTTAAFASASSLVPEPFARLWRCLLQLLPALRSEYMQALVLLVCPLILVAAILVVDLRSRRRVLADHGTVSYRPSLAVRFAWMIVMTALLASLFPTRHQNWILLTANLLALLELVRTFPRSLTLAAEGLHWRSLGGSISLSWEHISCFAEKRSVFGTEYQLCGDEDQIFVLNSAVIPAWRQIVRRIGINLAQRHLHPASTARASVLNSLHRFLLPIALLIAVAGSQFTGR
jgi:hypothetical protein